MSYQINILRHAQKSLSKLPQDEYERIKETIQLLATTPRPNGSRKLTGREGWRLRVGDYRVIYEIDDPQKTITVLSIGHRCEIYR
ncbi:type II toxin-antitoxin system RelE/ParE family toxin [Spirulina subsalsa CS-330]|uniref:type II toxin-antitoxin system RelE family toxin n=1 Tax=Spirulina TaxID=1154 RepID=UPI00232AAF22|nr:MULTISPECIES: type II toxin-antitoxin system RelE/ParE family toxin [Spirulina]MDB9493895.1 type II toxin-antitoxin system RelE/ParE family toxin [Spirulina subsalsa CS-330]